MKQQVLVFLAVLSVLTALAMESEPTVFPVPPQRDHSLFYIQRSKNTNAIVYEANVQSDGTLDPDNPLNIFWIRYTSDSSRAPLTYIQEKFAYGVKANPYPGKPGQYVVHFHAYPKKQIYLLRKSDGKHFAAYTMINGKYAELKRIFLKINGGSFWLPNIEYIEVSGLDMANQLPITERFKPAR